MIHKMMEGNYLSSSCVGMLRIAFFQYIFKKVIITIVVVVTPTTNPTIMGV